MKYNFDYSNLKENELIMLENLGSYIFIDHNGDDITISDIDKAQEYALNSGSRIYQGVLKASVRVGGVILYKFTALSNSFSSAGYNFIKLDSFKENFKGEYIIYEGIIK